MEFKKLLKTLKSYLDGNSDDLRQKDKSLSKVLKRLKLEELKLKEQIAAEADSEEREQLEQQLHIVHSQRKKGITLLASVREEGKDKQC